MSFTASTKVLLASGAAIPISQLKAGDKVLATNVKTGKTSAEPVAAVLVHHDTDRYDLTIRTGSGTAVIQTTSRHLFWDATSDRWVKAVALGNGDNLRTPGEATATVSGGRAPKVTAGWMWDLSVPGVKRGDRDRLQRLDSEGHHRLDVGPHGPRWQRPRLLHPSHSQHSRLGPQLRDAFIGWWAKSRCTFAVRQASHRRPGDDEGGSIASPACGRARL